MPVQPVTWILSGLAMGGLTLAGVQVSLFSATPAATALTARPDSGVHIAGAAAPAGLLQIERADNGLFYVNGAVNDVPVRFAVDTGATVVVLNAADAKRIGLAAGHDSGTRIRTAAGFSRMQWQKGMKLSVEGKSLGKIDIAVMPDGPETSLLGLNALSRLESITLSSDRLTIE
ncbi:MAG: TIGR02281 family clan AA aspartic protease [Pseudomonadota bacterium]